MSASASREWAKPGFLQLCALWFASLMPGTEQVMADVASALERHPEDLDDLA